MSSNNLLYDCFEDRRRWFATARSPNECALFGEFESLACGFAYDQAISSTVEAIRRRPYDGRFMNRLIQPFDSSVVVDVGPSRAMAIACHRLALIAKTEPGYLPFVHSIYCGLLSCAECACFGSRDVPIQFQSERVLFIQRRMNEEAKESPHGQ